MSKLAKSVEFVDLFLAGGTGTTTSGILTKGQDISNCVPFISWQCASTDFTSSFPDVWFTDVGVPAINVSRTVAGTAAMTVRGYVIEFDPAKVRVYQGAVPTNVSYGVETPVTITTSSGVFDQNRTAMNFYYRTNSTPNTNYLNQYLIRGRVNSDGTTISFIKQYNGTTTHYGHYYAFESIDEDFIVTHYTGSFSAALYLDVGVYDWHNTFLITSYCGTYLGYSLANSALRAYLWGSSQVHLNSEASSTIHYNTQKIEFNNSATASGTRYCPKISSNTSLDSSTLIIENPFYLNHIQPSEYLTIVLAQNPSRSSSTVTTYVGSGFFTVCLTNSDTKYKLERGIAGYTGYPTFYLVDWAGQDPQYTSTGTVSGTTSSGTCPVKSVENISLTFPGYVAVQHLSKGQEVSNCVVFKSGYCDNTSVYNQQYNHETFSYFRGNELYLERGGPSWSGLVGASIVEFYPDQVRVQQGEFCIGINSVSTTVTLDVGVDVSKTFLVFGHIYGDTTVEWGAHTCIGYIASSTTIVFERGRSYTYPIMGAYYLVEDLKDWWVVSHHNSGSISSTNYSNLFKDCHSSRNGFALISSSLASTTDAPYYAGWRTYYHGPMQYWADRYQGGASCKVSLQVIKFTDTNRTRVHYKHTNLPGIDRTTTYSPYDLFKGKLVTPVFTNLNGLGRVNASSALANTSIFMCSEYNEDTNEITVSRNTNSNISHETMNSVYTVCWDGYVADDFIPPEYFSHNSFIKSIEKFSQSIFDKRMYFYLTKDQDVANCLPICTWSIGHAAANCERFCHLLWFDSSQTNQLVFESYWEPATGNLDVDMTVLEFDPTQVRIQSGNAWIWDGESTTTINIDEVDLTKAFIVHYTYISDSATANFGLSTIATKFNSSTQLYFKRYRTNGYALIKWYVVECLQDQWEVQRSEILNSNQTYYTKYMSLVPTHSSWSIFSYSLDSPIDDPYHIYFRTYLETDHLGITGVTAHRPTTGTNCDLFFELVNFNESYNIYTEHVHFYFSSSEYSKTYDLGREYNTNTTIIWAGQSRPAMALNTSNPAQHHLAFVKATFQDSRTLKVERYANGTYSEAWGHVYLIEFPMITHKISGVVRERGEFISRNLHLHKTNTGELIDSTVSNSSDGTYAFYTTYSGSTYVVCFDDDDGADYNGLVETGVYPEIIPDAFPVLEGW